VLTYSKIEHKCSARERSLNLTSTASTVDVGFILPLPQPPSPSRHSTSPSTTDLKPTRCPSPPMRDVGPCFSHSTDSEEGAKERGTRGGKQVRHEMGRDTELCPVFLLLSFPAATDTSTPDASTPLSANPTTTTPSFQRGAGAQRQPTTTSGTRSQYDEAQPTPMRRKEVDAPVGLPITTWVAQRQGLAPREYERRRTLRQGKLRHSNPQRCGKPVANAEVGLPATFVGSPTPRHTTRRQRRDASGEVGLPS
jgi:hypothetical protein